MPSMPDKDGRFNPNFPQPLTKNWLSEHYKAGGWVESLMHYSAVELALYYEYRGGRIKGWAGSVGDATAFIADCEKALTIDTEPNYERIRKLTLNLHKNYLIPAINGRKFAENRRKAGQGESPIKKAVRKLLNKSPSMKNAEIWKNLSLNPPKSLEFRDNSAGKYIEGDRGYNMDYARFCNVCAEVRRQ